MQAQAEHVGTRMMWDTIVDVDLANGPPFRAVGDGGDEYIADTIVIATGAQAKWLGAPGEAELGGKGVSACATCDGFFYRGKKVAVIGGGNTAVEEALYLTNHSDDVTLIHRRDELRSEKILANRLFKNPKISTLWNKTVESFEAGENGTLNHLVLKDTETGETSTIEVDGAFVAIGHAPSTELFKGKLPMDASGYLDTEPGTPKTAIPGVFAAGDVTEPRLSSGGDGCGHGMHAQRSMQSAISPRLRMKLKWRASRRNSTPPSLPFGLSLGSRSKQDQRCFHQSVQSEPRSTGQTAQSAPSRGLR